MRCSISTSGSSEFLGRKSDSGEIDFALENDNVLKLRKDFGGGGREFLMFFTRRGGALRNIFLI